MLSSVQIFAAGDMGDEAFELLINGKKEAAFNLSGTQDQVFTFKHSGSVSADDVRIQFVNDLYDPANGIDRNLRIDKIVIDGITYETEDPSTFSTGTWKPEDGITPGFRQSEILHTNGYFQYSKGSQSLGSELLIRVRGDEGTEQFNLVIRGEVVGTFSANKDFQTITYRHGDFIQASDVRIEFINDVFDPANGIDANLVVDFISIDGTIFQTEDPSVFSTGSWRPEDGIVPGFRQSETLNTNGFFQFGAANPNLGSEVTIRVRGDEGTEQFNLIVQGNVVRTFPVTKDFQTITYRHTGNLTADDIRIEFINDRFDPANGIDANLVVDFITVDGVVFQTEDPSVFSTGSWRPEDGIVPGFRQSETLNTNGFFQYSTNRPAPNQNPVALPDRFDVVQGETVRGNVGLNDFDPDGDDSKLVFRLVSQPSAGQLTFNSDGSFVFNASNASPGEISFTYSVTDERGGTSTALVTFAVAARTPSPVTITVPSQGGVATGVVWELNNLSVTGTRKYPFPNGTSGVSTSLVSGGSFTIREDATPVPVGIVDNDGRFNDGDTKQVLARDVTINGIFERAGKRFTPEYSYQVQEAGTGRIINIYAVELGSNKTVGIVSDAPLQTGVAYTFLRLTSNHPNDLTYDRLADSYIVLR